MWINVDDFRAQFEVLKADCHDNTISVTVVTAADCDALAAQRILAKIFGRYFVQFKAVPLSRYGVLQRLFEREADREMNWVLLNCGGSEDVTQWLHPENHKVYIVDNHRPLHLHNIESDRVFIFDDGNTKDEFLHRVAKPVKGRKRRRHSDVDDVPLPESDADSPSESEAELSQDVDGGRKRKHMPKEAERDYYSGCYYGLSAAATLYILADQLHVSSDPEVLWMAILGITEQFLFRKISKDVYREQIRLFQESVHARLLHKPTNVTFGDGFTAPKFNEGKIVADDEYKFMLLRHWSLYESMWHSQYVASRLGLYTSEKGKLLLDTLLSKVGISPQLRKSVFSAIPDEDQKSLKEKLLAYGRAYGLRDFTFRSFFRHQGYGFALSAADLVYGVAALLEQPTETEPEFRKHFWRAYETLQSDDSALVKEAIELAKAQQAALVRQATVLIAKSGFVNCGAFRVGYLNDSVDAMDLDCLRQPGILQRMARFLSEIRAFQPAVRQTGAAPADKPVVLAAKNRATNTWVVVGVPRDKSDGTVDRNKFSNTFRLAALKSRAKCTMDGVDPASIEVHQDSLRQFMDAVLYHTNADS